MVDADIDGSNTDTFGPRSGLVAGGPNQAWTRGADRTVRGLGKCLDVVGPSTADGAAVHLWTCNAGQTSQQWQYTAAGDLVNVAANKCLDIKDNNLADGARLQLWSCAGGANQKWNVPA